MATLTDLCETHYTDCRRDQIVRLRQADGTAFEQRLEINYPPVQNGEFVTVFPDETIRVSGDIVDDKLINLVSVGADHDPATTIVFEFNQMVDEPGMTLNVKNPFPRLLKYRLGLQLLDREELLSTSSCPVIAGGHAFEIWPHPIFQLAVMDLHFLPEDSPSLVCD